MFSFPYYFLYVHRLASYLLPVPLLGFALWDVITYDAIARSGVRNELLIFQVIYMFPSPASRHPSTHPHTWLHPLVVNCFSKRYFCSQLHHLITLDM